ncbi:MAG: hypothetical protein ABFQ95_07655, partial [Pseudomonadota bacterium]
AKEELFIGAILDQSSSNPDEFTISAPDFNNGLAIFMITNVSTQEQATISLDLATGEETFADPNGIFADLAADDSVTFSIDYRVSDGQGRSDDSVQAISIAGLTPPPTDDPEIVPVPENNLDGLTFNKLDNSSDPITLRLSEVSDPIIEKPEDFFLEVSGAIGDINAGLVEYTFTTNLGTATLALTDRGLETWMDPDSAFIGLAQDENVVITIEYQVIDPEGRTIPSFQAITVEGVNTPPVDGDEIRFIKENKLNEFVLNKLENATDVDTPKELLFLSAVSDPDILSKPADFMLEVSDAIGDISAGLVRYEFTTDRGVATLSLTDKGIETFDDPDGAFLGLVDGEQVKIVIDYVVSDGQGGTDNSFEKLIIVGKGDPLIDGDEFVMVNENEVNGFAFNKLENANRLPEDLLISAVGELESSNPESFTISLDSPDLSDGEVIFVIENVATQKTAEFILDVATGEEVFFDPKFIFRSLFESESVTFTIDYEVSDGAGGADTSTQEIIIKGESPIALGETSNIVLYLSNGLAGDDLDVKKVKFEGGDQEQFAFVDDLMDWVDDNELSLGDFTDFIAFAFKQGNNFEENLMMAGGEGQLVTLEDGIQKCPEECTDIERLNDDVVFLEDLVGTSLEGGVFLEDNQYIDGGMF